MFTLAVIIVWKTSCIYQYQNFILSHSFLIFENLIKNVYTAILSVPY